MTNAFYVALTFKLRTMGSAERAAQTKAAEDSPWDHLGVEREDLEKSVTQVAGTADIDLLLPFAQRLWNEPVWEFKVAALKTLALDHVSTSPELWDFVKSTSSQVDGPRLAYNLAAIARKCLNDYPGGLADTAPWFKHRNAWVRCFAVLTVQAWADADHDVAEVMPWLSEAAIAPADCVQEALAGWLKRYGAHDPDARDAFLAESGAGMSESAKQASR